ncbi:MAG: aspartyl protease family protein [Thermoproteota archaeon]
MRFPYQKEKSSLFGEIYRPIAELEVETGAGWITLLAYIDSGADISILPASFLKAFEIKVEEEKIREIRGVGGAKVPIVVKDVKMKIGELVFNAKIAIALIEDVPYILGREGVFDKFEICFKQKERIVEFKPTT